MARSSVSVGLEIDEACARAVVLKRGLRGACALLHVGEWPLPRDAEERETALREALATLKAKAGTNPPAAWFDTTQGGKVSVRLIHIPPVPRHEVKGAVLWQARTQIPFPLDHAVFDHALVGEVARAEGAAPQLLVMFGAAAEDVVLQHTRPFDTAGLRLSGLVPTAAALWSARTRLTELPPGEAYALVHVGGRAVTICVGKGDTLSFTREITLPGGPIITDNDQGEPSAVVRELRRTLHHYRERHRGETVTTVVLSGAVACSPGVAEVLTPALGCTVRLADPLGRVAGPGGTRQGSERSPAFAIATAAALGGAGINLLPPSLRPRTRRSLAHVLVPAAAAVVLAAGSYQWSLTTTEPALRAGVERTEAELQRARARDEQILRLKGRQARLERLAQVLPRVSGERVDWQEMFRAVTRSLPANVALRSLNVEGAESATARPGETPAMKASLTAVAFGGESEALASLAAVIESLQTTGAFSGVRVSAPMRKSKEYSKPAAEFGLSFDVVPATPAPAGATGS